MSAQFKKGMPEPLTQADRETELRASGFAPREKRLGKLIITRDSGVVTEKGLLPT